MATWREKLTQIMKRTGESQNFIGQQLDISQATMSRYMNGETSPTIEFAIQLADRYGLTLDDLFRPERPLPDQTIRVLDLRNVNEVSEKARQVASAVSQVQKRKRSSGGPRRKGA